jgi:hypothetical protein
MAVEPALLDAEPDALHDVALFNPGESEHNTIVLGGVDVVIPLELDMDGDPFQDDAVCLRSQGGDWEHVVLSSDSEVTAARDKRHLYYPFHEVPSGVYNVDVRIAENWITVISNLLVSRGAAYIGDEPLGETVADGSPALDDPHALVDREEAELDHTTDCGCGH